MKKIIFTVIVAITAFGLLVFGIYFVRNNAADPQVTDASLDGESGTFLKETQSELPRFLDNLASIIGTRPRTFNTTAFADTFSSSDWIEESGSMQDSESSDWWVNSGGSFQIVNNSGRTYHGDLDPTNRWRREYLRYNPVDTDNGLRPQNIFRLVQRGLWDDLEQQVYFKINRLNISDSPNRNASNGLFLFNRYQSGDDLYYTGIRVDGAAVIKKKIDGTYYTMAYAPIIRGAKRYDEKSNPNLLPLESWLGLRSEITTNRNGTVNIKLYTDIGRTGNWTLALQAVDDGVNFGDPIIRAGFAGIRTDFMDAEFKDYSIRKLSD